MSETELSLNESLLDVVEKEDEGLSAAGGKKEKEKEKVKKKFESHEHELEYHPNLPSNRCNVCKTHIYGSAYRCADCDYDLCNECANKETKDTSQNLTITLNIVGGCWNIDILGKSLGVSLFASDEKIPIKILSEEQSEGSLLPHTSVNVGGDEYEGVISKPIQFLLSNIHSNTLKNLKLSILFSNISSPKDTMEVEIVIDEQLRSIAKDVEKEKSLKKYWNHVKLNFLQGKEYDTIKPDRRGDYQSCKIPKLYCNDDELGWMNIEFGISYANQEPKILPSLQTIKTQWIDDIEIVKMIVRNGSGFEKFGSCLTSGIFTETLKIFISGNWKYSLNVCVDALVIIKTNLREAKQGNWIQVQTDCEEIVSKLLDNLPKDVHGENKFQITLEEEMDILLKEKIVKNELKVFSSNDSFQRCVTNLWRKRNESIWPIKYKVSPSFLWKISFLSFLVFLGILTYHIHAIDRTNNILFSDSINSNLNYIGYDEDVSDFQSFWEWFNNSLIPGLYGSSDTHHLYILADHVLVRQIRVDPIECYNPLNIPLVDNITVCYPRLYGSLTWHPSISTWGNVSTSSIGKSLLKGIVAPGFYGSEAFTIILSKNKTEMEETLSQIDTDTWIDWGSQAIIIEFAIYSPNTQSFAVCSVLSEFTNVGEMKGSHECAIISTLELQQGYDWTTYLLLFFFVGFLVEEIWEYMLFLLDEYVVTTKEKLEAEEYCRCVTCVVYVMDFWNILDLIMIITGITFLAIQQTTLQYSEFTLSELWVIAYNLEVVHVFAAICVVIAYLRLLHYLTPIEYIGVLVITFFHMLKAVIRFCIIFIFIVFGFSSAFHSLYGNLIDYYDWPSSTLNTLLRTLSGYQYPDYINLLAYPGPVVGLAMHTVYIIIGVVLLLNFLIALMNSVYELIHGNAKEEYRWMNTRELTQFHYTPWPIPLNLLQAICAIAVFFLYLCNEELADSIASSDESEVPQDEERSNRRNEFMSRMVSNFFGELPEGCDSNQQFDSFEVISKDTKGKRRIST